MVGSSANLKNSPRANELIAFRLDSSLQVLVIAPVMTRLTSRGGGNEYAKAPKGNLDVTGQYFIWTDNMASRRLDAFIVKVPGHLHAPVDEDAEPDAPPAITCTVAGHINEAGDLFAEGCRLPEVEEGDILAFLNAGGYAASMASRHCARPPAAERMV